VVAVAAHARVEVVELRQLEVGDQHGAKLPA
jgi:hypothetical protein